MKRIITLTIIASVLLSSCVVGKKKFLASEADKLRMQTENEVLQEQLDDQTKQNVDLNAANKTLTDQKAQLKKEKDDCETKLAAANKKIAETNQLYNDLNSKSKKELAQTAQENQKLQLELAQKQRELADKEAQLQQREERLQELQGLLAKKDEATNQLKKSIENALLNFNKDELTVEMRDGKIYVSLAEQLLFKSGSTAVDPKGQDALGKLAGALKNQTDIDILIEGHTDSIPIKTTCIKDNWDLGVLRATSIVRILTDAGIDEEKIVPSGRGEFTPVATNSTKEGRAANRRTEIILSPKLDEVFKILNSAQ